MVQRVFVFIALSVFLPAFALAQISPDEIRTMQTKVQSLVKKATPAVVALVGSSGTGSGVVVDKEGTILTAAHVMGRAETIQVVFPDGTRVPGKVLGGNDRRDIGMVKITKAGEYPFVEIGDSDALKTTDIVVTLGHPGGFDIKRPPPVRIGRVYNTGTDAFIRSDCTLIGGDSGGPLLDLDGKVVGIHSSIGESLIVNNHAPVNVATDNWERMKKGERWGGRRGQGNPDQPVMGLMLSRDSEGGVLVDQVFEDGPADKVGFEEGDLITKFGDAKTPDYETLFAALNKKKPGEDVKITLLRDGKEQSITLKLARRGDFYR